MFKLIKRIVGAVTPTKKTNHLACYVWPRLPDEIAKQFKLGKYSTE